MEEDNEDLSWCPVCNAPSPEDGELCDECEAKQQGVQGYYCDPEWEDEEEYLRNEFQDPGGNSALRRATPDNPRNQPCPTCKQPNRLTPKDVALRYQCDQCADRDERGW